MNQGRFVVPSIMVAVLLASFCCVASAQPGIRATALLKQQSTVVTLPTSKAATKGFTADIAVPESRLPGYFPVRVTIRANTMFTSDRQIILQVTPIAAGHSPASNTFDVQIPIKIAEGTRSSETMHYLPRWTVGNAYRLALRENSQRLEGYETEVGSLNPRTAVPSDELLRESDGQWIYLLGADDERPSDVREIISAVSGISLIAVPDRSTQRTDWEQIESAEYYREVPIRSTPDDWRGYQSVDAVLAPEAVFESLRDGQPSRFRALRDWALCGGTVVVTDSADESTICQLFDVSTNDDGTRIERLDAFSLSANDLMTAERETMNEALEYVSSLATSQITVGNIAQQIPGWNVRSNFPAAAQLAAALPPTPELIDRINGDIRRFDRSFPLSADQWQGQVTRVPIAAGQIIGLKRDTEESRSRLMQWRFVRDSIGTSQSAMIRRGVEPILGDSRVRRWLIPGVAEPPVYTFMGLLCVFVVLVGPVAYRQTTRQGRSHLMFAIAPALALFTTFAMFGYGILADGFGAHTRVRQLTWVDGASGDAGQRVRATYFAGIRPGEGLGFPRHAEVMHYPDPVGQSWEAIAGKNAGGSGQVRSGETEQRFNSSFLPSRQQKQFVFHHPVDDFGGISLVNGPIWATVSSSLQTDLRDVVCRDVDGRYWTVDVLPAGSTDVKCKPLQGRDVSKTLFDLYLAHRPISRVVDSDATSRRTNRFRNQTINLMTGTLRRLGQAGNVTALEGLFEQRLQQWLQIDSALPPMHFVGITSVSDDVISIDDVELVESVHYVFGTLKP